MNAPVNIHAKGYLFGAYARCLIVAKGDVMGAHAFAMGQGPAYHGVSTALKGAVAAMSSGDAITSLMAPVAQDFAALVRPISLIGRLSGVRQVPFNTRLLSQATGVGASWIGEGAPVVQGAADFDKQDTMGLTKIMSLSAHTRELVRFGSPGVELTLAQDAAKAAAYLADQTLVDPDNAGSAVKPASITKAATQVPSSGVTVSAIDTDLKAALAVLTNADIDLGSVYLLMPSRTAAFLSLLRGSGGSPCYPGVTAKGGVLAGLPVLTSPALLDSNSPGEASIVLCAAEHIALADDGDSAVEVSEQADMQMVNSPTNGAATMVNAWAHGLVSLRTIRVINWKLRRAAAVTTITGCAF